MSVTSTLGSRHQLLFQSISKLAIHSFHQVGLDPRQIFGNLHSTFFSLFTAFMIYWDKLFCRSNCRSANNWVERIWTAWCFLGGQLYAGGEYFLWHNLNNQFEYIFLSTFFHLAFCNLDLLAHKSHSLKQPKNSFCVFYHRVILLGFVKKV